MRLDEHLRTQVGARMYEQVCGQVNAHVNAQANAQANAQVHSPVYDQVYRQGRWAGIRVDAQVEMRLR